MLRVRPPSVLRTPSGAVWGLSPDRRRPWTAPVARQASALARGAGAGEGNAADRVDALDGFNEGIVFLLCDAAFLERSLVMVDFFGLHHLRLRHSQPIAALEVVELGRLERPLACRSGVGVEHLAVADERDGKFTVEVDVRDHQAPPITSRRRVSPS